MNKKPIIKIISYIMAACLTVGSFSTEIAAAGAQEASDYVGLEDVIITDTDEQDTTGGDPYSGEEAGTDSDPADSGYSESGNDDTFSDDPSYEETGDTLWDDQTEETFPEDDYTEEDALSDTEDDASAEQDVYGDSEAYAETPEDADLFIDQGLILNEDGMYEYTYDDDSVIEINPEDPELYRYFPESDQQTIRLEIKPGRYVNGGYNPDPFPFKYNTSLQYRYPSHYRTSDASKRVGVRYGLDISKFQKEVTEAHFRSLKNEYGVDFVIIRAGYRGYGASGSLNVDDYFAKNVKNAYKGGLAVGVYYFSQAITTAEAKAEANHCMEIIEPYRDMITLPVTIDYEYAGSPGRLGGAHLSAAEHTKIVNAFCKRVLDSGYVPMIYANKSMLQDDMVLSGIPSDYLIWMANYVNPDSNGICSTTYSGRLNAWQFTSKFVGVGPGGLNYVATEDVDMDFWFGDFPFENSCRVTFNSNGGSKVSSQLLDRGDKVRRPDDPKRTGYTFINWYKDRELTRIWDFDTDTVSGPTTLYAKWKINTYTVTFEADEDNVIEPQYVDHGQKIIQPALVIRPGYTFGGWFKDKKFKTKWRFKTDVVTRNIKLYAKITANPAELVYMHNGGWGNVPAGKGLVGETLTVEANTFTRPGHTFVKWNTEEDGSGDTYTAGDDFALTTEKNTLYAIWKARDYTVTFEPGEDNDTDPVTVTYESLVEEPETVSPDGFILEGWYKDSEYRDRWDFAVNRVRRDITLYAKWIHENEDEFWGDLEKAENLEVREMYENPTDIPEGLWIYGVEDKTYTGSPVTQKIKVFYNKIQLKSGTDYKVKYTDNTNAGTASVKVTGKGTYEGTARDSFDIASVDLSTPGAAEASDISLTCNGKVQKGTTSVRCKLGNRYVTLKAGKDFEYVYPSTNKNADDYDPDAFRGYKNVSETTDGRGYEEYTVRIIGKNNYSGELSFTERILAKDNDRMIRVSQLSVSKVKAGTLEYDGDTVRPYEPVPVITYAGEVLQEVSTDSTDDGYSLSYRNNTFAGTAVMTITGHGRYTGTRSVKYKVRSLPMSGVKVYVGTKSVNNMPSKEYTGGPIVQSGYRLVYRASAKASPTELVEGRDYSVSYKNNVNTGKATVTFSGRGIYSGKIKKKFKIKAISFTDGGKRSDRIGVYMAKSVEYKKGGAKPDIEVVYDDGEVSYVLVPGRDYTLKYSNHKAVNDASRKKKIPTVKIIGRGNYSGSLKEYFRITPAQ